MKGPGAILLLLGVLVSACTTVAEGNRQSPFGSGVSAILYTDASRVFVNGQAVGNGTTIRQGDRIETGAGASALIEFSNGTSVQLDQSTDPVFAWTSEELNLTSVDQGLMKVEKQGFGEVRVSSERGSGVFSSTFFIESGEEFRADLLQGRMQLVEPVVGPVQEDGEFFRVGPQGAVFGSTSATRMGMLVSRMQRWRFNRQVESAGFDSRVAPVVGVIVGGFLPKCLV